MKFKISGVTRGGGKLPRGPTPGGAKKEKRKMRPLKITSKLVNLVHSSNIIMSLLM